MDPVRQTEEEATHRRANVLGFNYFDAANGQKELFKDILSIPEMYSMRIIPLAVDAHHIEFGITTTTSQQTLNALRQRFTDQIIKFSIISDSGYRDYMKLYDPPKKIEYQDISITAEVDAASGLMASVNKTLQEVRPDDMLAYLVQQAYQLSASDIHLESQKDNIRVRFRVDGVLHPVASINPDKYRHLIASLASASNISTQAKDPQSGHISRRYKLATGEEVTVNLRVETVPAFYGMDVVMRLFRLKLEYFRLENLGLSQEEAAVIDGIIAKPTGLVLIVGPTGSGKTTTLYSIINTLNTPERKIITLEDPVEYNIPGVTQIPVAGELGGQNFAEKLRAVLRLDPDIVMVGEIRDADTAKTALQSALTGHLVLSTFHAGSAAAALTRMVDLVGINPLFASAIRVVMAQRLVRRLDDSTKKAYQPDDSIKRQIAEVINGLPPNMPRPNLDQITLYAVGGSEANPFGYSGQLALREQLVMSDKIQQLLKLPPSQITTEALQSTAVESGMRTMLQDGILKALAGQTTIDEIYRVVG